MKVKELYKKHREIITYIIFGALTTAVSFISYSLFVLLFNALGLWSVMVLGATLSVNLANLISWVCAVLFAFITNKLWVFESKSFEKSVALPEFVKFVSSRIATGVLEIVLVPFLIWIGLSQSLLGIDGLIAKLIVTVLVIILNYILSKLLIFKK